MSATDHKWHVFLSYSRRDEAFVTHVAKYLQDRSVRVWFDRWEVKLGDVWQEKIEEGIKSSGAVAVFIGPGGPGTWERPEMRAAIDRAVNNKTRTIPVLLPGVSTDDESIPIFLRGFDACSLTGLEDHQSLDRLSWAVSGRNPIVAPRDSQTAAQAPSAADGEQIAVEQLAQLLRTGNVTFFIGGGAADLRAHYDITMTLLRELQLIDAGYDKLLPSLDLAGSFFAASRNDADLEDMVIEILAGRHDSLPAIHRELVALLQARRARADVRGRRQSRQLIVTTSFDLNLEKALLAGGIPFTRLVQYRSLPRIKVNVVASIAKAADGQLHIGGPREEPRAVSTADDRRLGDVLSGVGARKVEVRNGTMYEQLAAGESPAERPLDFDQLPEPVLYKLLGSQDVVDSCTISTDQYYDAIALAIAQKGIPEAVAEIISNTPMILLGSRILDCDFRLSYAMLKKPLESGRGKARFAVIGREPGDERDYGYKLGLRKWDTLRRLALSKYGIDMLDASGDAFLRRLRERSG